MRLTVILAFAAFTAVATTGHAAEGFSPHSWGKLDISYLQYRTDVAECGYAVVNLKIDPKTSDHRGGNMMFASDSPSLTEIQEMAHRYKDDTRRYLRDLKLEIMIKAQAELDACLSSRGYSRFRLTPEQTRELSSVPAGSQARQKYLYRIASDPEVLRPPF